MVSTGINPWHQNQVPSVLCTHYFACSWLTTLCEFSFINITLCVDCHLLVPKFGTSMYCNNVILELLVFNFWHIQPTLCCRSLGDHIHNSIQLDITRIKKIVKNLKSEQLIPLSNAVQMWYDVNTFCHVLQSYSEFVDISIINFECLKYIF